jgi:RNA polymerase sigma-70 factor (ECF subfamily)
MNQETDENLVNASRNGDMAAFKVLVERYEGKVAGIIKSMLGGSPEALDTGQEVFIRFYESLDKFRGEAALGTYLIRIAINLSLNEIKKRKRNQAFFSTEESGLNVNIEPGNTDLKEAVHYEINRLESEFKSVVILRMIEGYNTEETAEILNVPMGTVLSRLSRAQKKLKLMLAKHFEV